MLDFADIVLGSKRFHINWHARTNLGLWYKHDMGAIVIRQIGRVRLVTRGKHAES